jgi:hypothetical protein
LGSRDKPVQNADGSTDLYLGPKAPAGKQGNWHATVPGTIAVIGVIDRFGFRQGRLVRPILS